MNGEQKICRSLSVSSLSTGITGRNIVNDNDDDDDDDDNYDM